ncbi:hypothetical protein RQM47_16730 [Rubrivirga sp. S365]|uniref:Addiction module component n=1 Tax=Rubrivirga litoralis TaxID=3075598 RepID=A0ABU3BVM0_9BACT|nr:MULTISPECIES: hypothetical protein [unclassified Rubrivirga]MDT0633201.1 hypothetical protein [Rubrivirga sp. F394]MDT7858297.1 hypothetical protein [Rubrivirga sp. S365]
MSLQEIERAIADLPDRERAELVRWINENLNERADDRGRGYPTMSQQEDELIQQRRELAEAAAPYWAGGDGLEYQVRIRTEWDDRPGADR